MPRGPGPPSARCARLPLASPGPAIVVVWNWSSGTCLQMNAERGQATYVLTHPYAYAAACGVPEHDVLRVA